MAQWKTAATASGRCICGVAWIEFNASRPACGCKTTRVAAEVMWDFGGLPSHLQDQSPPEGGCARRFGGINVIVRGPGARPIQGRSTRGSTAAAPDLPRAILTHAASRDARPPEKLRGGPSGSSSAHCRGGARVRGHDNQTGTPPPPRSRPRTRHRLRPAGAVPFPPLTGGSAEPLSTAALLSTLEIGLGPSAARPLRRGAGRPVPNTISSGGGLAEGNGSAFNWLSRARRAPSDFPSPVAPPPSCELVAPRGAETRERRPEPGLPSQVRDWSRGVPAPG